MISVLNLILGNNVSGNNSLSTAQMELLLCLSRQRVDIPMEQTWAPIAGPLEQNIAKFVSDGLLEDISVEGKIDAKYKVQEIRQMLESRGIKAKGKKQEMISVLLGSMPAEQAEALVSDIRMFGLTEAGIQKLEAYRAAKEKAWNAAESEAIALLVRGDARKAWARMARHFEGQLTNDPKWTKPVPDMLACEASYLVRMPYDDLPLTEYQRREFGAQLALSVLLGETFEDAGNRIGKFAGSGFEWGQVLLFSRPSPCGSAAGTTEATSLAELYATTRIHEALQKCGLNSLKSSKLGKGIKVLPVNGSECQVCHSGKYHYSWSELEQLPKLPRQMGCYCTYAAWL